MDVIIHPRLHVNGDSTKLPINLGTGYPAVFVDTIILPFPNLDVGLDNILVIDAQYVDHIRFMH